MLRKKYGGKPAQKIATNMSFLGTYMTQLTCFEWKLSHLSAAFCQNMLKMRFLSINSVHNQFKTVSGLFSLQYEDLNAI